LHSEDRVKEAIVLKQAKGAAVIKFAKTAHFGNTKKRPELHVNQPCAPGEAVVLKTRAMLKAAALLKKPSARRLIKTGQFVKPNGLQ